MRTSHPLLWFYLLIWQRRLPPYCLWLNRKRSGSQPHLTPPEASCFSLCPILKLHVLLLLSHLPLPPLQCAEFLSNVSVARVGGRQHCLNEPLLRFLLQCEDQLKEEEASEWMWRTPGVARNVSITAVFFWNVWFILLIRGKRTKP